MNKPWKLTLLLVGIFLAGGASGALIALRLGKQAIVNRPPPGQWAPMHLKRIARELELTREQLAELEPIVKRNMEELGQLRTKSMAETRVVFERMEREVTEKLSPAQREKYEKMNRDFRERARKFMPGNGNRPPGPPPEGDFGPGRGEPGERPAPPSERPSGS